MKRFFIIYKQQIVISFFAVIFGVIMALTTVFTSTSSNIVKAQDTEDKYYRDTTFPDYQLKSSNQSANLSDIISTGRTLVVYIYSGCRACQTEIKLLSENDLSNRFGIKVAVISLDNVEEAEKFKEEFQFKGDIFPDQNRQFFKALEIKSTPTNFLINNGKIEKSWVGMPVNGSINYLYEKLGVTDNAKR